MVEIDETIITTKWDVKYETPLVSIKTLVYNHEKFLEQAIDSFLLQKTNFPFEIIIHDDASTDNSASIIKRYEEKFPHIVKPIYETENVYSNPQKTLSSVINPHLSGKYIAFCEGDDFWIDNNKLQKQVDFLENNEDYGLCYSRASKYIQSKNCYSRQTFGYEVNGFNDLLENGNRIPTLTVMVRKSLDNEFREDIDEKLRNSWIMGDYPLWLYCSNKSKIKFMPEITAVYRVLENSASHSLNFDKIYKFRKSYNEVREFFSKKYKKNAFYVDDNRVQFECWFEILKVKYSHENSKKLRLCYKEIKEKSLRLKIINFVSYNKVVFHMFLYILEKR